MRDTPAPSPTPGPDRPDRALRDSRTGLLDDPTDGRPEACGPQADFVEATGGPSPRPADLGYSPGARALLFCLLTERGSASAGEREAWERSMGEAWVLWGAPRPPMRHAEALYATLPDGTRQPLVLPPSPPPERPGLRWSRSAARVLDPADPLAALELKSARLHLGLHPLAGMGLGAVRAAVAGLLRGSSEVGS